MEENMKHIVTIALAAALVGGGTMAAQAGSAKIGASASSPGHQMQAHGSVAGHPGASGYAPGHLKSSANVRARTNVHTRTTVRHHRSTVGAGVRID
jgi:hypothetical protein